MLLVDSFLNHQVDVKLMKAIGEEFARLFKDDGITRIATIESSGIAPAAMTALAMDLPMVIMKKSVSSILKDGIIQTEVFSFTKNAPYLLTLKTQFVQPGDRVLLIDDFLANGEAAFGGIRLLEQAGAKVAGVGAVIAKAFQPGMAKLRAAGYRVEALAPVKAMGEGFIEFEWQWRTDERMNFMIRCQVLPAGHGRHLLPGRRADRGLAGLHRQGAGHGPGLHVPDQQFQPQRQFLRAEAGEDGPCPSTAAG